MTTWRNLALLAAVIPIACGQHDTELAAEAPGSVRARLARAERIEVRQEVEVQGTVEARQTAAVSARVMAMVTAVHVKAGDPVQRGQLLLEIDPQTAKGQVAQARGALSQARAALALAERNYERFRGLAEAKAASDLEVDMARMQYEQAQGAVEQAEGAVAAASSVAGDARVEAPFAGRIAQRMVDVGDLAAPGRPLLMLESTVGRQLVTPVPESLMQQAGLRLGDRLRVTIDSRPDLSDLEGTVVEMTPGADPASHSFRIKLDLPLPDLITGAAGRARVPSRTRTAVVVPGAAVLSRGGMDLVVIRNAEGLASSRVVTIGQTLPDGRREILSGLTGDETVLVGLAAAPPIGSRVEEAG
jgi:RND family efflux transporter MFP subunit